MSSAIDANLNMAQFQAQAAKQNRLMTEQKVGARDVAEIKKISDEFESMFLNLVMKSMRDTVQKSGLVDGGNAEDIYKSLLDDEYTKMMAQQRSTGIADNIEEFLLRAQAGMKPAVDPSVAATKAQGLKAYQDEGLQTGEKQAKMKNGESKAL